MGVTLDDRNGTHGEVIACLIDAAGTIESFVMSCRVFQRRAEFAFIAWLAAQSYALGCTTIFHRPSGTNQVHVAPNGCGRAPSED